MRTYKKAKNLGYHSEHGKSFFWVKCECGYEFKVYVWSYFGSGKKCPNCKNFITIKE